ncbi:MAG: phenylalanine--tRNA ligase subunit beta [bacterium]|nr:phenylalanine--tRNA ligase subunit beta [bacterium]
MAGITISKKDLESLLKKALSIAELETLLHSVKGELKETNGDELKIDLDDTNRPDLLCTEGIAREIKNEKTRRNADVDTEEHRNLKINHQILVDEGIKDIRPYIGGFIAKGLSLTEGGLAQLIQTQEKLADNYGRNRKNISIGIYNAEEITFPVSYKAVAPEERKFVPLEFDREITLKEILELHPKGKEYAYILKGFSKYPLLEDSKGNVLSFPPIINSNSVGRVETGNSNLFCDITGTNLEQVLLVSNILAQNLKDRGAEIILVEVKYPYDTKLGKNVVLPYDFKEEIKINKTDFEKLLGLKLETAKIIEELDKSGYRTTLSNEQFTIKPPSYRRDIMHSVDVIEDFAIRYGYNNFEPEELNEFTVGKTTLIEPIIQKLRKLMIGAGFEEIVSNILTSKNQMLGNVEPLESIIEIENPVSDTYSVLRNSIVPSLLSVESISSKSVYPHKIFEIGEVVVSDSTVNYGSRTIVNLTALISYPEASFSDLHSVLDILLYYSFPDSKQSGNKKDVDGIITKGLGYSNNLQRTEHPSFIKGRAANILVNNKSMGIIGEVHPQVLEDWKIRNPVVVFELKDIEKIFVK